MSSSNESTSNNTCVVCYKNVEIYSIGICEHPVCHECSTRMRVLCRQNECPICRQELPKVVFTREVKPYRFLRKGSMMDTRYHIYFDTPDIQEKFYELLTNYCKICKEKQVFSSFNSLKDHMRQEHQLHYCDLCVENLKIFSHERRCYTRSDLALHRRKGDVDDKSHKGHPLCEFCDQRYMDNDELYRHLRRDHLYCHFCDADGLHQYYSSYDYLRDHFRQEHFLCEEGQCAEEKFTSVFRTDIDLRAHRTSVHCKQLSKAAAKQARTLELEFTLAPRGENRNRRGFQGPPTWRNPRDYSGRDYERGPREYQHVPAASNSNNCPPDNGPTFVRQPSVDVQSTAEFPTLGNAVPYVPTASQSKGRGNVTIRSTVRPQTLAVTDENFPALGPDSGGPSISKTVNFSVSSSSSGGGGGGSGGGGTNNSQSQKGNTSNVSIQVNHESNGTVTTRVSGPNIRIRPAQLSIDSDFPALGSAEPSTSSASSAHWKEVVQWTCSKSAPMATSKSKKTAPPPLAPSPPPIQSGEDFPSLAKPSKSKKQSTIMVMPSWGNSQNSHNNASNASNGSNAKGASDATKSKTKKKKVKQPSSGNNSSGNESNSSKSANDTRKHDEPAKLTCNTNNHAKENMMSMSNSVKCPNVGATSEAEEWVKKDKKKSKQNTESSCTTVVNTESGGCGSNKAQRKRTELKIDSLNSTNNNILQAEDFPALGNGSKPPGFTNPPPGFGTTTPPPPGFCIKYNNLEQLHGSNGLTFTNSSGESYSILPDDRKNNSYTYLPPSNFQERNKCLVAKLNEVLVRQDHIEDFRCISGLFRQGNCDAEEYYTHCREVMGATAFDNIFSELLVLLPDIAKQQELYKIHRKRVGARCKGLEICTTCSQVLKCEDSKTHVASHTMENDFPALGKGGSQPKNIWVRK